jgi:thiol-disulfide isomerase/thioredoxin
MNVLIPLTAAAAALYLMPRKTPPLRDGEKSLTFYYMNGCPHCKRMYPDVRALGSKYRGVIIRWVEANSNDEADIDGFPTLIYRDGAGKQSMYDGPRTAAALKNFINHQTNTPHTHTENTHTMPDGSVMAGSVYEAHIKPLFTF